MKYINAKMSAKIFDERAYDSFFYTEEFTEEESEKHNNNMKYEKYDNDEYYDDVIEDIDAEADEYYDELLEYHKSYFDDYNDY
jgi:hypothetical protein